MTESSRGRILFALHETGYFRLYGSAIVELERRGWDVSLAFDRPDKRGSSQLPAGSGPRVTSLGALPDETGGWLGDWRAVVDYLRYLEPAFAEADYLRRRSEKTLPQAFHVLTRVPRLPGAVVGAAVGLMRLVESAVTADPRMIAFVRAAAPDVLFVSPLVTLGVSGSRQTELIKAARALSIPVVVGAASWDHLTSKGLVRVVPDVLTVWNDAQVREAVDLHRIPRERIVVTGAQSLDHWFEPRPSAAVEAFRRELDVPPGRKVVLFVGSSRNMAGGETEVGFVRRWIASLRSAASAAVREAVVVVRPHPSNTQPWRDLGPGDIDALVHPTSYSGMPLSDAEVDAFRYSLLASDAVVGVNTTAMIEAAILERPVLTVRDGEFVHSQAQTLHFAHLVDDDGCALVAGHLDEHVTQLAQVLQSPTARTEAMRRFVGRFVRPCGMRDRATDHLCTAIERVARASAARAAAEPQALDEQALAYQRKSVR